MCRLTGHRGQRVGEALHPGPPHQTCLSRFFRPSPRPPGPASPAPCVPQLSSNDGSDCGPSSSDAVATSLNFRVAVVNPTALHGKESDILSLNQDMVFASETSAVSAAQSSSTRRFQCAGWRSVWSPPVPSHHSNGPEPSLRGCAEGVALLSRFPLRGSFSGQPKSWNASCRLVEGFARVGWLAFRVIGIHGFPANRLAASTCNDSLFHMALQVAVSDHIPTVIGGDFNTKVQDLPVWAEYQRHGFQEMFEFWEKRTGEMLPPTCRASTRHDTLLMPPLFQQLLRQASVNTSACLFDSHAPLQATFEVPDRPVVLHRWRMPRTWANLPLPRDDLARAYDGRRPQVLAQQTHCQHKDHVDAAFLAWATAVEESVHDCVVAAHAEDPMACPIRELSQAHRGRFQFRPRLSFPLLKTVRAARQGDYNPPNEITSIVAKAKVRQARRLRTYQAGLAKARRTGDWSDAVCKQLTNEWTAIKKARGYPPHFSSWLLALEHFDVFWANWPPAQWLAEVTEYVCYDADALARLEKHRLAQLATFRGHLDTQSGHSRQQYAALRDQARPPITALPVHITQQATCLNAQPNQTAIYSVLDADAFREGAPAQLGDVQVFVQAILTEPNDAKVVRLKHESAALPPSALLRQSTDASTGTELHRAFVEYWAPIWLRDTGAARTDAMHWAKFMQHLPPSPPQARTLQNWDPYDEQSWLRQVRRLKPGKATGYDGFSNAELRMLPETALLDLMGLFKLCGTIGWPSHLGSATVTCLAKTEVPQGMQHARPITILASAYRPWASHAARGILQSWGQWFPQHIFGCLPQRSVRDLSLQLECLIIERSIQTGEPLGGFSIDLVQAFNNIPRQPLQALLTHLHVPSVIIDTWFAFLPLISRHPVFVNDLGCGLLSTTGVPEGDPLSVVGMLALCYAAEYWPRSPGSTLMSYVDNFTWVASDATAIASALDSAQDFCSALCLPIDWSKSFCWSTVGGLRQWLKHHSHQHMPEGTKLQLVESARDLGVVFGSDPGPRLAKSFRGLQVKAHMLQTAIWPATFYGLEGQCMAVGKVDAYRSAAAQALFGKRTSMSPFLACGAVSTRAADPEAYLLAQALNALARMMRHNPDLGEWWLQTAANYDCGPRRVSGPASALAKMLHRQEWVLKPNGVATGPGHWFVDLRHSSPRAIRVAVNGAWCSLLPSKVGHRNGLSLVLPPAADITEKALSSFGLGEQCHLAQTVVGGFMSAAARSKWDKLQEPQCLFCGALDSKHHRLLHCPALQSIRQPFATLLEWVQSDMPHWLHCPFGVEADQEAFSRLLWRSRAMPLPPGQDELAKYRDLTALHLYTDGSCSNNTCPQARHAAWAVVIDTMPDQSLPDPLPETKHLCQVLRGRFHVVSQGIVPGQQSIGRAEFCAILRAGQIAASLQRPRACLWTDSAFALQASRLLQVEGQVATCSNVSDLLPDGPQPLPQGLDLQKVKSHVDLHCCPPEDRVRVAGNHVADAAAKAALAADLPLTKDLCSEVAAWRRCQQERLTWFFQYLLELTKAVVPFKRQAKEVQYQAMRAELSDAEMKALWLSFLPPQGHISQLPAVNVTMLGGSTWPQWFLEALWNWALQLKWSDHCHQPPRCRGITYLELLANFVVVSGRCPPVSGISDGHDGQLDPLDASGLASMDNGERRRRSGAEMMMMMMMMRMMMMIVIVVMMTMMMMMVMVETEMLLTTVVIAVMLILVVVTTVKMVVMMHGPCNVDPTPLIDGYTLVMEEARAAFEQRIVEELTWARTRPVELIDALRERLKHYKGKDCYPPERAGQCVVTKAWRWRVKITCMISAADRARRYGNFELFGECLWYGSDRADARCVVLDLIIDDGVPSRGHRLGVLDPRYDTAEGSFQSQAIDGKPGLIESAPRSCPVCREPIKGGKVGFSSREVLRDLQFCVVSGFRV
ncbi:FHL2 [Symbiodinium sp. KB8]|nr:FHL2 [Symbiodinium sp. KB8]